MEHGEECGTNTDCLFYIFRLTGSRVMGQSGGGGCSSVFLSLCSFLFYILGLTGSRVIGQWGGDRWGSTLFFICNVSHTCLIM